jgi:hypothetical protein
LKKEPIRLQYNEGSREFFEKTYDWYNCHHWDFRFQNNETILVANVLKHKLMDSLLIFAKAHHYMNVCKAHGLFDEMEK